MPLALQALALGAGTFRLFDIISVETKTARAVGQVIRRVTAIDAFSRSGVGRHPACLNFGD